MDTPAIITTISSGIFAVIGSFVLFVLTSIRKAQEETNIEIKEMNRDIRDTLVKLGANDEKIIGLNKRIDDIYEYVKDIVSRVTSIEENEHN